MNKNFQINGISFSAQQHKKLTKIMDYNNNGKIDLNSKEESHLFNRFFDANKDSKIDSQEQELSKNFLNILDMSTFDFKPQKRQLGNELPLKNFPVEVKEGWDKIPVEDQNYLTSEKKGFKINLSNYTTKLYPELEGQTPRNYSKSSTFNSSSAFAINSKSGASINLMETIYIHEDVKAYTSSNRNRFKTQHEAGHIICEDFNIENNKNFKQAYSNDLKDIPEDERQDHRYFTELSTPEKPHEINLSETCAEAYAASNSPELTKAYTTSGEKFINNFENSIEYVQNSKREKPWYQTPIKSIQQALGGFFQKL